MCSSTGDANDQWVQSRGVWNQHSYHITNVNDDGTIPVNEVPSWTSVNSYRSNRFTAVEGGVPVDGCAFAKPDLTALFLAHRHCPLPPVEPSEGSRRASETRAMR